MIPGSTLTHEMPSPFPGGAPDQLTTKMAPSRPMAGVALKAGRCEPQATIGGGRMLPLASSSGSTGGFWDNSKNAWVTVDFTSGTVYSKNRWKYGYFEGRFQVPWQKSCWPAFDR